MKINQDQIFSESEGDQWFRRNAEAMEKAGERERESGDLVLRALDFLNIRASRIIEIGASNGYRLELLRTKWDAEKCVAIEPSKEAISNGRKKYPQIDFRCGIAGNLPVKEDENFDLAIFNFVFHWIDRASVLRSVSEVDRILSDGGHVVIGDFYPQSPAKVRYHHIKDRDVWTYKQDYSKVFTASALYSLVGKFQASFKEREFKTVSDEMDSVAIAVLRKNMEANYRVLTYQ